MKRIFLFIFSFFAVSLSLFLSSPVQTKSVPKKTSAVVIPVKKTVKKTAVKTPVVRSYRGAPVKSTDAWKFQKISVKTREQLEAEEEERERALLTHVSNVVDKQMNFQAASTSVSKEEQQND
jgi:hypothetical protein